MMEKDTEELLTDEEWGVTLAEIELEGLVKYHGEEEIEISEKGIDFAWPKLKAHTPKERFMLVMLIDQIIRQKGDLT